MNVKLLKGILVGIVVFANQHLQQVGCKPVIDEPFDFFIMRKHLFSGIPI